GRITTVSYSADGLTQTTLTPAGATLITSTNLDGSIITEEGTGQQAKLYSTSIVLGLPCNSVSLPDGTLISQTFKNGFDETIKSVVPTTIEDCYILTISQYNTKGQLISQQQGSLAPTQYTYNNLGQQVKTVFILDADNPDSVTANRVTEQSTSFESLENGIYQVSTSTRYNAEGTALTSTQKQLISKLSETLESHTISIDERGLTSESQTFYGESLVERLQTSTVPTSDSVATATIVDDFTTAQTDQLGGTYSFTREYTETGITSTVTDPRGNTVTQKTDVEERTIEEIDAAGNSLVIQYCVDSDNPARIIDARGGIIEYSR
ncbi:MAG: hypothetical protein SNG49_08725, partial [Rikenellaceae bacterium]